jgi:hypothetical protein
MTYSAVRGANLIFLCCLLFGTLIDSAMFPGTVCRTRVVAYPVVCPDHEGSEREQRGHLMGSSLGSMAAPHVQVESRGSGLAELFVAFRPLGKGGTSSPPHPRVLIW